MPISHRATPCRISAMVIFCGSFQGRGGNSRWSAPTASASASIQARNWSWSRPPSTIRTRSGGCGRLWSSNSAPDELEEPERAILTGCAGEAGMRNLRINGERLWASLMELARLGATTKGGVCRLAASDLDGEARRLFIRWCEEAGCTVRVDQIGNIFAHRPGRNLSLPPVMTGSHLDTQPTGGKFDGAYGVMAGLEVVRTLNDLGYETEAPIEIVAWTNEEGSRFSPAMVGSGVFADVFDLAKGLARPDNVTGVTLGAELERIGFAGPEPAGGRPVAAYFEAHIEQGPILEAAEKPIGIVTGAQGQRWYEITVTGQEAHAGPTPMPRRRDALVGAARMIDAVNRIGHVHAPYACATLGFVQDTPNSPNTIPGRVFFTVDFRHPE